MGEEDQLPVALGKLAGWRKEQGCPENQTRPVMMVVGQGGEDDVDGHGYEDGTRNGVLAVAAVAEAEERGEHECERGEGLGEEQGLCLSQQDQGDYGGPAELKTAPSWHWQARQRGSTGWLQACN